MQPQLQSQKFTTAATTKRPTVLQKVARKILAPIRNIPLPSSPGHSRSSSASSSSTAGLRTPQTPTMVVQMRPSGRARSHSPSASPAYYYPTKNQFNGGGVFVFPSPTATAARADSTPSAPASPTNSIQRRRGAIVELPQEWYAKAEEYHALGIARTRTRSGVSSHEERLRRVKSYEPSGSAACIAGAGAGVRRGKSAQAALGVAPIEVRVTPASPTPDEVFEFGDSFAVLDDGVSVSLEVDDDSDDDFLGRYA